VLVVCTRCSATMARMGSREASTAPTIFAIAAIPASEYSVMPDSSCGSWRLFFFRCPGHTVSGDTLCGPWRVFPHTGQLLTIIAA
jgi:hypothetical protein